MSQTESVNGGVFDAVIIGAGVAGAMTAILLSRAGLRTLLLERHQFPRNKVCGCCVNGRAVHILRDTGLEPGLQKLSPASNSILAVRYRDRSLEVTMPPSFAVSRRVLDQWLVDEAVSSGCAFVDGVTATVEPLTCDAPGDTRADSRSTKVSEFRSVQLLASGGSQAGTSSESAAGCVYGRVVVICDGLGHPSLHQIPSFSAEARRGSRIGLGAIFPRSPEDSEFKRGQILMAVAPQGYVGVVEIENEQLNLAAAISPSHLHNSKSPFLALESVLRSAGVRVPSELCQAAIKGTLPLTRRAQRIAGHRLLLLGDAAGYIEPFTGEGIAWALSAARAVAPLIVRAVRKGWSEECEMHWQSVFSEIVRDEQSTCRMLSAAFRRPWLLAPMMTTCRWFPSLARHFVQRINRVPQALESHR